MTGRGVRRGAARALSAGALLGSAALAVVLNPSDTQRQQEMQRGQALADKRQGYPVKDYIIYSVPDAYTLQPGEGSVEAVQIATPLERTRWGSYFLAIQNKPVTPDSVGQQVKLSDGNVAVIIYAHSQGGEDKDKTFLQEFKNIRLTLNGQTLRPTGVESSGPSRNNYRGAQGQVEFLWSGNLTARFDLSGLGEGAASAQGHLTFTDATGKSHSLPVALGKFQ